MKERLTARTNDGTAYIISETGEEGACAFITQRRLSEIISRLAYYEDKAEPKELLPDIRFYGIGTCPSCNAVFTSVSTNYCGNCGQALKRE